jgi:hypothetical protein
MKNGFKLGQKRFLTSVERQRMVISDVKHFLVAYERNRQIIKRLLHR